MELFPSFSRVKESKSNLNKVKEGPLFHTVEYELSTVLNKVEDVDNLNTSEIEDIIIKQHSLLLDYNLLLSSEAKKKILLKLITNEKFIRCFLNVVRILKLSDHEKTYINKLTYDYNTFNERDQRIADLLYIVTTEINAPEITIISSILGLHNSKILVAIKNSSFEEKTRISRVNNFFVKCDLDLSVQNIVDLICKLFKRFTNVFIYTMMQSKPNNLTDIQNRAFDRISLAMLEILNSLPSRDIKKVLQDYGFMISMVKHNITVRFSIKSVKSYDRIINIIQEVENENGLIIP